MKTYKFYLKASNHFLSPPYLSKLNNEEKEYNNIASILLSWISIESYVNAMCESLSKGTRLEEHERLFLQEEQWSVDDEGEFRKVTIRPPTLKKVLFIIQHFTSIDIKVFKQSDHWNKLRAFEDLRNKIVHHKEKADFNINLEKAMELKTLANETIDYLGRLLTRTPKKKH